MPTMIPRSKMSKKARRELDARRRNTWQTSPVTKRVESAKRYVRRKMARVRYDDSGAGFFLCCLRQGKATFERHSGGIGRTALVSRSSL